MDTPILGQTRTALTVAGGRFAPLCYAGTAAFVSTASTGQSVMACAGVLKDFYLECDKGPGTGKTRTFAIYKNGEDTGLKVTLEGEGTGAGISQASDTTHTVAFKAEDTISLHSTASAETTSTGNIRWGLLASCASRTSFCLALPGGNLNTNGLSYLGIYSELQGSGGGTEPTAEGLESAYMVMPTNGTLRNLYVVLNGAPGTGAGQGYTFTIYKNGAPTAITFEIFGNVATTGKDTTHSVSVAKGDLIVLVAKSSATVPIARQPAIGCEFDPEIDGESIHLYGGTAKQTSKLFGYQALIATSNSAFNGTFEQCVVLAQTGVWKKLYVREVEPLGVGSYRYAPLNDVLGEGAKTKSPIEVEIGKGKQTGESSAGSSFKSTAGERLRMFIQATSEPPAIACQWGLVCYIAPTQGNFMEVF
jgi:hypothetical protein